MSIKKALKVAESKKRKRSPTTEYSKVSFTRARCYEEHNETEEDEEALEADEADVDKTDKQMKEMALESN